MILHGFASRNNKEFVIFINFKPSVHAFSQNLIHPILLHIQENSKVKESATQNVNVFGAAANIPDLASLTSDGPSDKASGGFLFGSGTSLDFSSLAASGNSGDFTWKIGE